MLQGNTQGDGIALMVPNLPRLGAASEVEAEPLSTSLTWKDREASGHDVVLACQWAGEMVTWICQEEEERCLGVASACFLKHPSCCHQG